MSPRVFRQSRVVIESRGSVLAQGWLCVCPLPKCAWAMQDCNLVPELGDPRCPCDFLTCGAGISASWQMPAQHGQSPGFLVQGCRNRTGAELIKKKRDSLTFGLGSFVSWTQWSREAAVQSRGAGPCLPAWGLAKAAAGSLPAPWAHCVPCPRAGQPALVTWWRMRNVPLLPLPPSFRPPSACGARMEPRAAHMPGRCSVPSSTPSL